MYWKTHEDLPATLRGGSVDFGGVFRCKARVGCPYCSPVTALRSAQEIVAVVDAHQERHENAGVLFLTCTLPHDYSDQLKTTLDVVLKSWTSMRSGRTAQRQLARWGNLGYVRALDLTVSDDHGWHPHIHAILLLERRVDPDEIKALEGEMYKRWNATVQRRGLRPVARGRFRIEIPRSRTRVCEYVAEISGVTEALARELQGGAKTRRVGGRWYKGVTAQDLYTRMAAGDRWAERHVMELEGAMYRRKWVTWSKYAQELRREIPADMPDEPGEDDVPLVFVPVWFHAQLRAIPHGLDVFERSLSIGRGKWIVQDWRGRLVREYVRGSPIHQLAMCFETLWRKHRVAPGAGMVPPYARGVTEDMVDLLRELNEDGAGAARDNCGDPVGRGLESAG